MRDRLRAIGLDDSFKGQVFLTHHQATEALSATIERYSESWAI